MNWTFWKRRTRGVIELNLDEDSVLLISTQSFLSIEQKRTLMRQAEFLRLQLNKRGPQVLILDGGLELKVLHRHWLPGKPINFFEATSSVHEQEVMREFAEMLELPTKPEPPKSRYASSEGVVPK